VKLYRERGEKEEIDFLQNMPKRILLLKLCSLRRVSFSYFKWIQIVSLDDANSEGNKVELDLSMPPYLSVYIYTRFELPSVHK